MNLRGTLGLLALCLALGVWVTLDGSDPEGDGGGAGRIFAVEEADVTALEIPQEDGRVVRIARQPAGAETWMIESPLEFAASSQAVGDVVRALVALESSGSVSDPPDDLSPFGLGETRRSLRLWSGEEQSHQLHLGGKAPVGGRLYASVEGRAGEILLIDEFRARRLTPELDSLRETRMVSAAADEATSLRISRAGAPVLTAVRDTESGWQLVEPIADRADPRRVQRLLEDFERARATGFVDGPGPLSDYGLDPPEVEVELDLPGEARETIQMGEAGGQSYLRIAGADVVFRIADRIRNGVPRDVFELRDKRVFEAAESAVHRIELEFPGEELRYAFERGDPTWQADGHEANVDPSRLEDVAYALSELDALEIPDASIDRAAVGLDPPRVRVHVFDEAGESLGVLALGDPQAGLGVYAVSSQNDRVWILADRIGEDIPLGIEAFRNRWLEATAATDPED